MKVGRWEREKGPSWTLSSPTFGGKRSAAASSSTCSRASRPLLKTSSPQSAKNAREVGLEQTHDLV